MKTKYLSDLLDYRREDSFYKKYSKYKINNQLYAITSEIVSNKLWKKHLGIGYFKSHYTAGITLSEYILNAMQHIGEGDILEGKKLFLRRLTSVRYHIKSRYNNYTEEEINNALMYRIFFKSYIGFVVEELLEHIFKLYGFEVIQSRELDDLYKIDMVVKHQDYVEDVGIQCKSITYLNVDDKIKKQHLESHKEAVRWGQCFTAIYIYHNDNVDVVDENEKTLNIGEIIDTVMKHILKFHRKRKNTYSVGKQISIGK